MSYSIILICTIEYYWFLPITRAKTFSSNKSKKIIRVIPAMFFHLWCVTHRTINWIISYVTIYIIENKKKIWNFSVAEFLNVNRLFLVPVLVTVWQTIKKCSFNSKQTRFSLFTVVDWRKYTAKCVYFFSFIYFFIIIDSEKRWSISDSIVRRTFHFVHLGTVVAAAG